MEKYGRAGQATADKIIRRMNIACWITKATGTRSEYVILILFYGSSGYANAPQCYVIRTLPLFVAIDAYHVILLHFELEIFVRIL